ncbi:MAG TPA: 16S rRNA (cytosine(967)-C(5))-methyltransferase RsmB [Methylomirabilota bacterium]|nr:16S rRNA (cytosine(967)-C(5))-methyltransferase RsmB [Methylomirabilota bacterium]
MSAPQRRTGARAAAAPARALAARVLERVEVDDAFADLALDAESTRRAVSPRDAALATELVYGTLRWQRYLDWIVAPHSRRRLEALDARVRVLLRMTAYQLVFLERVPAFAAVNDAVTLARAGPRGAAEYANAVLRSFARRGAREREPAPPRDPVDALAVRCSFPTWLAARWVARWGAAEAEALMRAMNERPPLTVRANTLRLTREALAARLAAEDDVEARPTAYAPEGLLTARGGAPGRWRAFADGACVVQDEASMLVARLLDPRPGETVVDACAAPGTKTTHLAQLMDNRGRIVALDPQPARLARVTEAAARLGVTIVQTIESTAQELVGSYGPRADAVLVDAPCTNLGVLRRNPEVKWRRQPGDIAASAALQSQILTAAATLLGGGGRLVYATCSTEPEENEGVVGDFLARHPEFRVDRPADFPLPLDAGGFWRALPHRHGTDGFTAVRLKRA